MLDGRHLMSDDWRTCSTLGQRLKWARTRRGKSWTQTTLGRVLGVTRYTIGRYEDDGYIPPNDQIEALSSTLGVRPIWLLYGDGPPFVLPAVEAYLLTDAGKKLPPVVQAELRAWSHNFFKTLTPGDEEIENAVFVIELLLKKARQRGDGEGG